MLQANALDCTITSVTNYEPHKLASLSDDATYVLFIEIALSL